MNTEITHSHQLKITNVIPVTIQAARGYPAWIVVKVETDGGLEGIGEGFTWAGQARTISDCIASIGQQIKNTPATQIRSFLNRFSPRAGDRNWSAAVSAIEVALWDILGFWAGPLESILSGQLQPWPSLASPEAQDIPECVKIHENGLVKPTPGILA